MLLGRRRGAETPRRPWRGEERSGSSSEEARQDVPSSLGVESVKFCNLTMYFNILSLSIRAEDFCCGSHSKICWWFPLLIFPATDVCK
jgi:hypothetical protein